MPAASSDFLSAPPFSTSPALLSLCEAFEGPFVVVVVVVVLRNVLGPAVHTGYDTWSRLAYPPGARAGLSTRQRVGFPVHWRALGVPIWDWDWTRWIDRPVRFASLGRAARCSPWRWLLPEDEMMDWESMLCSSTVHAAPITYRSPALTTSSRFFSLQKFSFFSYGSTFVFI